MPQLQEAQRRIPRSRAPCLFRFSPQPLWPCKRTRTSWLQTCAGLYFSVRSSLFGLVTLQQSSLENTVVYDVTDGIPAGGISGGYEFGDQITLAGTNRAVQSFRLGVLSSVSSASTFDLRIRFYANDGLFGRPNTLLWSSQTIQGISVTDTISYIDLAVPSVVVPSNFTWTAVTSNNSVTVYRAWSYSSPSVGTFVRNRRFNDFWITDSDALPQAVRITAFPVPDASPCVYVFISAVTLVLNTRRIRQPGRL